MNLQRLVTQFHRVFGLAKQETPGLVDKATADLRMKLIEEETREVVEAIYQANNGGPKDLAHLAKELADLVYVVYGTAVTYGIDLDRMFGIVHLSNMSKLDENGQPIFREDGKILKGPNYWEAEPLLETLMEFEMTDQENVAAENAVVLVEGDVDLSNATDVVVGDQVVEGDESAEQPTGENNDDAAQVSTDGDATESAEATAEAS